MGPTFKITS